MFPPLNLSTHLWFVCALEALVVFAVLRDDKRISIITTVSLAAFYVGRELIVPGVVLATLMRTDLSGDQLFYLKEGLKIAWLPVTVSIYKLMILIPLVVLCVRDFRKREAAKLASANSEHLEDSQVTNNA